MFELTPYFRTNRKAAQVYDPFREMEEMERRFFGSPIESFRSDIKEEDNGYVIETDMPGFRKEDIHLDLQGDTLTISARRDDEREERREQYIRCERCSGSYQRSFDMSGVDTDGIHAKYENGVLRLTLPKKAESKSESKTLRIE